MNFYLNDVKVNKCPKLPRVSRHVKGFIKLRMSSVSYTIYVEESSVEILEMGCGSLMIHVNGSCKLDVDDDSGQLFKLFMKVCGR